MCCLDSLSTHFCCPWKQGSLISFPFSLKIPFQYLQNRVQVQFSPKSQEIFEIFTKIVTLKYYIKFLLWSHPQEDEFDLEEPLLKILFFIGIPKMKKLCDVCNCWISWLLPKHFKLSALRLQKLVSKKLAQVKSFLKGFWNSVLWKSATSAKILL